MWLRQGLLLVLWLLTGNLFAADLSVEVVGHFRDRAVVRIDGQQYVLKPGQRSPEGVRLVEATESGATLEIQGEEQYVPMGSVMRPLGAGDANGDAAAPVTVYRDARGMFTTVGVINGMPVPFLVDTGATTVAMNADQARRLGIDYRVNGRRGMVETASGVEPVYQVTLSRVKVGSIELHNIRAVVLEGRQPSRPLLGMSFLGRLSIVNEGDRMILRKKY